MASEKTSTDSIRYYLTGAASDGAAQTDPDASLGNFRSSTATGGMTVSRSSSIANITLDFVSGANATGTGTLTATGSDTLTWQAPGDASAGAAVTILNGETKVLQSLANPEKYVRVTRTSATALSGTETDTLAYPVNNVVGLDNVTDAERVAGDTEYRCVCFKNDSVNTVKNLKVWINELGTQQTTDTTQLGASGSGTIATTGSFADWPDSGFARIVDSGGTLREIVYYSSRTTTVLTIPTAGRGLLGTTAGAGAATDVAHAVPGIRLGKDAPTTQPTGSFVDNTSAGEGTAPAGVVFQNGISSTDIDVVNVGDLNTLEIYGIWIGRSVVAGATTIANMLNDIGIAYEAA